MPLTLSWREAAFRLLLAAIAGSALGINRSERGNAAGLRTTMLICLAAAVSMVQANLLMVTDGKTATSFSVLDLMRLPLGILTGVGFIGAGAIVKRGKMVNGVTTAAVLWIATGIGLCFGGGQLALGAATTVASLILLPSLGRLELVIPRDHRGTLTVASTSPATGEAYLRSVLLEHKFSIEWLNVSYTGNGSCARLTIGLRWRRRGRSAELPSFLSNLARRTGIVMVRWET